MAKKPEQELLEEFGELIVPALLSIYSALIKPAWRTLDVIEHTEATIHRVVRLRDQRAKPPELHCRRMSPSEIQIIYQSARRLCGFAKGIPRGLATHFGERVTVSETSCMLRGEPRCEIWVRLHP
jgi:predicted hydrocarbon binding protein